MNFCLCLFVLTLCLASFGFASPAAPASASSLDRLIRNATRAKRQYYYDDDADAGLYANEYDCKECLCRKEGAGCVILPVCGPCLNKCGVNCGCFVQLGTCQWSCAAGKCSVPE